MSDLLHFPIFIRYVRAYGESRADPTLDPYWNCKERPWWPMHYFMGDDVLGAWVYRIKERSRCEVGLFLSEDHEKYQRDSGTKGALIFLLTQTYHLLNHMEVRFVGPRDGEKASLETGFEKEIPPVIRQYVSKLGMKFKDRSIISDYEGRELYALLTGFGHDALVEFRRRGIDPTRACHVVQRDIWSFDNIVYLLVNAYVPERLFVGGVSPIARLSYLQDLLVLRLVIMEERLRIILKRFSGNDGAVIKAEWVTTNMIRYACDVDLKIPTLCNQTLSLSAKTPLNVMLLPRSAQAYSAFWLDDLSKSLQKPTCNIAVTRDFDWAGISPKSAANTPIITLFDTLSELDLEIERRLSQAITTRSELSERHD